VKLPADGKAQVVAIEGQQPQGKCHQHRQLYHNRIAEYTFETSHKPFIVVELTKCICFHFPSLACRFPLLESRYSTDKTKPSPRTK